MFKPCTMWALHPLAARVEKALQSKRLPRFSDEVKERQELSRHLPCPCRICHHHRHSLLPAQRLVLHTWQRKVWTLLLGRMMRKESWLAALAGVRRRLVDVRVKERAGRAGVHRRFSTHKAQSGNKTSNEGRIKTQAACRAVRVCARGREGFWRKQCCWR